MNATSLRLCVLYAVIAVLALLGTWHQNLHYVLGSSGFVDANLAFWKATVANPASISITVDLFLFGLAATIWMIIEARRLQLRFVWLYVLFGLLVAISVTFPLFMIARERRLAASLPNATAGSLSAIDVVLLAGMGLSIAAFTLWTLGH
jgi:hypothetical protein